MTDINPTETTDPIRHAAPKRQKIPAIFTKLKHAFLKPIKKVRVTALSSVGTYALDRLLHSKYARKQLNVIPVTSIAAMLRGLANFLLFSRLQTGVWAADFILSIVSTVLLTLCAPFFYTVLKDAEPRTLRFTHHVVDNLMGVGGFDYFITWRNRIVFAASGVLIAVLLIVPVTSTTLIESIVHFLISFWIVDLLNQWIERLGKPAKFPVVREFIKRQQPQQLTRFNVIRIPVYRVPQCGVMNLRLIPGYSPPRRPVVVNMENVREKAHAQQTMQKLGGVCTTIVTDYVG